VTEHTQIPKN